MSKLEKEIRDRIAQEIMDRAYWPKAPIGVAPWNQAIMKAAEIARGSK